MQTRKAQALRLIIVTGILLAVFGSSLARAGTGPGFIVLAPDRGFMGNNEIREVYHEFQKTHANVPSQLVFASRKALSTYLTDAVQALENAGATEIVVIPLFLSESDPDLQRARSLFAPSSESSNVAEQNDRVKVDRPLTLAQTLSASYLTVQILEDRAKELSETPSNERLIVIGTGASNRKEAAMMEEELHRLAQQVQRKIGFEETHSLVYLRRESEEGPARRTEISQEIERLAALEGRTLVVPFFISMKLTPMMSVENMLGKYTLRDVEISYAGKSILPHANVVRWLQRTANRYLPVTKENIGVVFMNHGSFYYYNEKVRRVVQPMAEKYKLEYAMSMGDPFLIQEAVSRLEARGATHIVLLRAFSLTSSFKAKIEYILGLDDALAENNRMGRLPDRVRSSALLYTAGGVEDDPLFAEVLLERALAISQKPEEETVILVAHGLGDDQGDERWRTILRSLASQMQALAKDKFKAIKAATWREDWPDKRPQAVAEVKTLIQQAQEDGGRALVVAARLEGNDPGDEFLEGVDFLYNEQGFSGHPNFTKWIAQEIEAAVVRIQGAQQTLSKESAAGGSPVTDYSEDGYSEKQL
ncbi:MAG: hypothetical protein ACE5IY_15250 [bacterium]